MGKKWTNPFDPLNRDARVMLKELELVGHKEVGSPFRVSGYACYRYRVNDFEWGLIYDKGQWRIVTSSIKNKPKYSTNTVAAKPETVLRHFIRWWMEYNIKNGGV